MRVDKGYPKTVKVVIVVLSVLVLIGFGTAAYLYFGGNAKKDSSLRTEEIKNKVARLIDIPKDEVPTIATVTDKEKLKDQPFFKDAQNEDMLLIFPQAKKAIIYREKDNRLINVGPIAITSDSTDQGATKPVKDEAAQ